MRIKANIGGIASENVSHHSVNVCVYRFNFSFPYVDEEEQRENAAIAAANNLGVFDMSRGLGTERERPGGVGGPLLHHNTTRNSIISLQAPLPGSQQRSGSYDATGSSRSGSIASSSINWRKGSVTIPEKSEDGEEEDEAINCSVAVKIDGARPRRLSESTPVKST